MREKEEIKERQKERIQKLEEKKKLIASQKTVEHKSEVKLDFNGILTSFQKEEHVWRKAQELFEKQRKLLQEREKLNQHLKVMGK